MRIGDQNADIIVNTNNLFVNPQTKKRPNLTASDWGRNWGKRYHQFAYRNSRMPFVGREKERDELIDFLAGDQKFKWVFVTGRAGSGKSTLVYNVLHENAEIRKKWKIFGLTYKQLEDYSYSNICQLGIKKIVFVFDYVLSYAAEIGEWIENIYSENEQSDIDIRIIVIERAYEKNNNPYWYIKLMTESRLDDVLGKEDGPYHVPLEKMSDEELQAIFVQYVQENAERYEQIYSKKLDPLFCRAAAKLIIRNLDEKCKLPLYILYIADAWISDYNKYGRGWNEEETLKHIVEKENQRIAKAFDNKKEPVEALRTILAYVMALKGLNLQKREFLQNEFKVVRKNLNNANMYLRNVFNEIGNISDGKENVLYSPLPDIVCEYYCLQFLEEKERDDFDNKFIPQFVEQCWKADPNAFSEFLSRIIADFHNHSMVSFDYILKRPESLAGENKKLYADILQEYTYWNDSVVEYCNEICVQYDEMLGQECDTKVMEAVYRAYAVTLFNMAYWYKKTINKNEKWKHCMDLIYTRSSKIRRRNDKTIQMACNVIEKIRDEEKRED